VALAELRVILPDVPVSTMREAFARLQGDYSRGFGACRSLISPNC